MRCYAKFCSYTASASEKRNLFRFPKNPVMRRAWLIFCEIDPDTEIPNSARLCCVHFESDKMELKQNFVKPCVMRKKGSIPTIRTYDDSDPYLEMETADAEDCGLGVSLTENSDVSMDKSNDQTNYQRDGVQQSRIEELEKQVLFLRQQDEQKQRKMTKMATQLKNTRAKLHNKCLQIHRLQKTSHRSRGIKRIFTEDQQRVLSGRIVKPKRWSDETVGRCLKLQFACGKRYEELRRMGYPLVCRRSLRQRLEVLQFLPGISVEIFDLLEHKVHSFEKTDRDCGVVIDEMAIEDVIRFDPISKTELGHVTLGDPTVVANNALVFMLVGVWSRWKQVVGYHLTSDSVNGDLMKSEILKVIHRAEEIGLKVHFVTSDCGACNKRMWAEFGIKTGKQYVNNNFTLPHPAIPSRFIEFVPDPVHVYKSVVRGWINNRIISFHDSFIKHHDLKTSAANICHLTELVAWESRMEINSVHRLTKEDVDFSLYVSNVDKMKVVNSSKYVNQDVAHALRFMADQNNRTDLLTTAMFIDQVARWYALMNSREKSTDMLDPSDLQKYEANIQWLEKFADSVALMKVGEKEAWKPWQSSVIIATKAIIRLQARLFDSLDTPVPLPTSRFVQDCIENLFSQVRAKQSRPNAVQFRDSLRAITISGYMSDVNGSAYETDERSHLIEYCSDRISKKNEIISNLHIDDIFKNDTADENLNNAQKNMLYHVGCMLLKQLKKMNKICPNCYKYCVSQNPPKASFVKFTLLKNSSYQENVFINLKLYQYFLALNKHFSDYIKLLKDEKVNVKDTMYSLLIKVPVELPECHDIQSKLINSFISYRLKSMQKLKIKKRRFNSKSMMM